MALLYLDLFFVFDFQQTPDSETELFDAACECVVSVLYRVEDVETQHALAVATLSACYAMAAAFKEVVSKDDSDKYVWCLNYSCRMLGRLSIFCLLHCCCLFMRDFKAVRSTGSGILGFHDLFIYQDILSEQVLFTTTLLTWHVCRIHGYTRIFCELNESFLECMVQSPGEKLGNLDTLEMLLLPVSYADTSVSFFFLLLVVNI